VGDVPFRHVYIHPKILDGFGETMSKSKGNGIDPLDIIERYGCDALRFGLVHLATENQDNRMPVANVCPHCDVLVPVKAEHMSMRKVACPSCKQPFRPGGPWPTDDPELKTAKQASDRFELGRNFANKIWNAARFLLMNLEGYTPRALNRTELPIEDRWILSRLATTSAGITDALENYHFADVARLLYEFVWSEFCDWYVEMAKGRLKGDDRATVQRVLVGVLDAICRLAHPVMPFLAESIWQALNEISYERALPDLQPATDSVVTAPWPVLPDDWNDAATEKQIARMQELIRGVREVRNRYNLEPRTPLSVHVKCTSSVANELGKLEAFVLQLAGVGTLSLGTDIAKPVQAAGHVTPEFEAYVSLEGLIDIDAEVKRLQKQIAEKQRALQGTKAKLENPSFVNKAPAEVVAQQREQVAELGQQIESLEANLASLSK